MRRSAIRVASVVAVLIIVGCTGAASPTPTASAGPSTSPSAAPSAAPSSAAPIAIQPLPPPTSEPRTERQPDGTFLFVPVSARRNAGVPYRFEVFTHCGFTPTVFDFDGSFWEVTTGRPDDGNGNPPPLIGNPTDTGVIVLVGPDEAMFTSERGVLIGLSRLHEPQVGFPCD